MSEDAKKQLALAESERSQVLKWSVTDQRSYNLAAEMLQDIKARLDKLEKQRKTITAPQRAALKATDALFKKPKDVLQDVEKLLKQRMIDYHQDVAKNNTEALTSAGGAETPEKAQAHMRSVVKIHQPEGIQRRVTYHPFVDAHDDVPREFMVVDLTMVRAFAANNKKADGSPIDIPGIGFERRETITSTKGKA